MSTRQYAFHTQTRRKQARVNIPRRAYWSPHPLAVLDCRSSHRQRKSPLLRVLNTPLTKIPAPQSIWGNLAFCQHFEACRILTAIVAFSWLGWIILSVIGAVSLMFSFANGALLEPFHGRWDPRASHVGTARGSQRYSV